MEAGRNLVLRCHTDVHKPALVLEVSAVTGDSSVPRHGLLHIFSGMRYSR